MSSLAHKVLDRFLDLELPLKDLTTDGLDVELIECTLKKLARDTKLFVELIGKIKDDLGAEVEKIPSLEIFEEGLVFCVEALTCIESVGDELELSASECKTKTERVELEVSGLVC